MSYQITKHDCVEIEVVIAFKKVTEKSDLLNRVIGWWTDSPYSHVEIVINDKWISADNDIGITINNLRPLKVDAYEYVRKSTFITIEHYMNIMDWINTISNARYDNKSIIFTQVLPFGWNDNDKWTCSEVTTKLLQMLNFPEVVDLYPHEISPGTLADVYNI